MSGVGMESHTATINPGTYNSAIGTTTIKAFCNDSDGFAIYAIGYTNDTDGNNTLTSTTLSTPVTINTGTALSGNSQWAMKLATISSPTPTYPITIQNSFDSFHTVPDDYTLVAKRTSSTDVGPNAEGSSFTSTYQAYISSTQAADTYVGKVKYVMVHPNYVTSENIADAVTVVFDGNGLTFPNGQTTNTVNYARACKPGEYVYVGNTAQEVMTSNILPGGEQDGAYTDEEYILEDFSFPDADKIKVVVEYNADEGADLIVIPEIWDGDWDNWVSEWDGYEDESGEWHDNWIFGGDQGRKTYIIDNNAVTIYGESLDTPESGRDYGFYVRVYPVYETEQPNTTGQYLPSYDCSVLPISGNYTEGMHWHGYWFDQDYNEYEDENAVKEWLDSNYDSLRGSTVELQFYSFVTFDDVYADNYKTKLNGYYKMQDLTSSMCGDVSNGETTILIDVRDNTTYEVGKLEDGNCWMRENLALDLVNVPLATLQGNTNASNESLSYLKNGGGSGRYARTAVAANQDANFGYNRSEYPYIATEGTCYDSSSCVNDPINGYWTSNSVISDLFRIGVYYNYCAASAGSYCYDLHTSGDNTETLQDASEDICPINWRMPTGSSEGEYQALYDLYDDYDYFRTDLAAALSGHYSGTSAYNQGSSGSFFSSTADPNGYVDSPSGPRAYQVYGLYVTRYGVSPDSTIGRDDGGGSVRCLLSAQ